MTPAGRLIAEEIAVRGPIPFSRFMEIALYHPEYGYYRRPRDPFGVSGDFYTAEQVQPVFGRLVSALLEPMRVELGGRPLLIEIGAGRRELEPHLSGWDYLPIDSAYGELPSRFRGVVFSNEFFDALPVDVVLNCNGALRERHVALDGDRFVWTDGGPARVFPRTIPAEGALIEVNRHALDWMRRLAASLERGFIVSIDYGYESREMLRFPAGTLMSYRHHHASSDVLADPGERDITSHVCFTDLIECGEECGLETLRFETLASALLRAGESDLFAAALHATSERESLRLRAQLKTLLFGMGETFRVLVQRRRS